MRLELKGNGRETRSLEIGGYCAVPQSKIKLRKFLAEFSLLNGANKIWNCDGCIFYFFVFLVFPFCFFFCFHFFPQFFADEMNVKMLFFPFWSSSAKRENDINKTFTFSLIFLFFVIIFPLIFRI